MIDNKCRLERVPFFAHDTYGVQENLKCRLLQHDHLHKLPLTSVCLLLSYKFFGDQIVNAVLRSRHKQLQDIYTKLQSAYESDFYRKNAFLHPLFVVAFSHELSECESVFEVFKRQRPYLGVLSNMPFSDFKQVSLAFVDQFSRVINSFPRLEYPLVVYRGVKWNRRTGGRFDQVQESGFTSTSLSAVTAHHQFSQDVGLVWQIILPPGASVVFLDDLCNKLLNLFGQNSVYSEQEVLLGSGTLHTVKDTHVPDIANVPLGERPNIITYALHQEGTVPIPQTLDMSNRTTTEVEWLDTNLRRMSDGFVVMVPEFLPYVREAVLRKLLTLEQVGRMSSPEQFFGVINVIRDEWKAFL